MLQTAAYVTSSANCHPCQSTPKKFLEIFLKKLGTYLIGITTGLVSNTICHLENTKDHFFRSSNLQARIDKLSIRVTQLDSSVDNGEGLVFDLRIVLD